MSTLAYRTLDTVADDAVRPASDARGSILLDRTARDADRMFAWLIAGHFPAALILAAVRGGWSVAILGGGLVAGLALAATLLRPGSLATRLVVGCGLMAYSAIFIQLSGGMIEAHFHIFASLAFLLVYRDWRVPLAAGAFVAVHHLLFNYLQPRGYGVVIFSMHHGWGIVAIHAGFVAFEVAVLCHLSRLHAQETTDADSLVRLASELQSGDLTARADTSAGAVGQAAAALNASAAQVGELVGGIKSGALDVASLARELTASTEDINAAAEHAANDMAAVASAAQAQATEMREVAAVMSEVVGAIDEVATAAERVTLQSRQAVSTAQQGADAVAEVVKGIGRARDAVRQSAVHIGELEHQSAQITSALSAISSIADQTNLLALNAAIEAARAGVHGRGFAVVAAEVRALSEQSQKSADEIAEVTRSVQTTIARAASGMDRGLREVEAGTSLAASSGDALREIVAVVRDAGGEVASISASASRIASDSRRVLVSMEGTTGRATGANRGGGTDLVSVSDANAEAAEAAAAALEEITASIDGVSASAVRLASVAVGLESQVGVFRV